MKQGYFKKTFFPSKIELTCSANTTMFLDYFGNEFSGSNIFCVWVPSKFSEYDASEDEHQNKQEYRWSAKMQ